MDVPQSEFSKEHERNSNYGLDRRHLHTTFETKTISSNQKIESFCVDLNPDLEKRTESEIDNLLLFVCGIFGPSPSSESNESVRSNT